MCSKSIVPYFAKIKTKPPQKLRCEEGGRQREASRGFGAKERRRIVGQQSTPRQEGHGIRRRGRTQKHQKGLT